MEIERLNSFIDAAQTLSFSETAHRLHVSQPTVSKYIGDIERFLRVRLFERSSTGLRLTEAGLTLLPWARHLVRECGKFEDLAKALQEDTSGRLRISCTTAAGKYILPQLAARFIRRYPHVQISIFSSRQEDVTNRLMDEKADLSVVSFEAGGNDLECQYFFTDHIIFIVPPIIPGPGGNSLNRQSLLTRLSCCASQLPGHAGQFLRGWLPTIFQATI